MLASALAFLSSAAVRKVLPYVLAALVVVGGVWFIDHRAYQRGWDDASAAQEAAAAAESIRVAEANKRAIQDALRTIDKLNHEKELRDAQIEDLLREGAADPTAGNIALPPSSVRRLNSVD